MLLARWLIQLKLTVSFVWYSGYFVIQVVDKTSQEAEIIKQYVKNTHAATHNSYTLDVEEVSETDSNTNIVCK